MERSFPLGNFFVIKGALLEVLGLPEYHLYYSLLHTSAMLLGEIRGLFSKLASGTNRSI